MIQASWTNPALPGRVLFGSHRPLTSAQLQAYEVAPKKNVVIHRRNHLTSLRAGAVGLIFLRFFLFRFLAGV